MQINQKHITISVGFLSCLLVALCAHGVARGNDPNFADKEAAHGLDSLDPRGNLLESKMSPVKLADVKISDVVSHIKLAKKFGCSVVMRGEMPDKVISIDFEGGTLGEFIDALCAAADARIVFQKFAVEIEPKREKPKHP